MPESQPAAKLSLSFAKLVATPTETAWSQAYNAGNVFVCISLTTQETVNDSDEELSLQTVGKDLFNILQSEFFTLQEKNIATIKTAIQTSLASVPQQLVVSIALAFFKENTLSVFIAGKGKIIMKRKDNIGILLAKKGNEDETITAASGYIENSDTVLIETGQFASSIPQEIIQQAFELELPNDIVEALSPQMHKQDNGGQSAIVILYRGATHFVTSEEIETDEEENSVISNPLHYTSTEKPLPIEDEPIEEAGRKPFSLPTIKKFRFRMNINFNHKRRLFLNIALILAVILIISIIFTYKKYNDDKQSAVFQSIYPQAQQYYSEGKGLATVNASLSQNSFQKAENLLKNGESNFSKGSSYYQQIADLLTQVDAALQSNTQGQTTNATAVQPQSNSLLADELEMGDGLAFGQNNTDVYVITNSAITMISKSDGTKKDIIKNTNYWTSPVAIVPYDGNIYVLDQTKGLLKFVAGGGGYGKDYYFHNSTPDLSSATGLAIDGSVWLLFKNGSIQQFTSGTSNNLQVSGLLKSLIDPTKIVTDITMESLYVLDNSNGRIVKFDKNGKYQSSYASSVITNAKDFTVDETNKKIDVLSQNKVWEINM